jgi:tetratricopeptide (TPR) repeat protein
LSDAGEGAKDEIKADLRGRFSGNPALDAVLDGLRTQVAGDQSDSALIARLRQQIAAQPDVFETRSQLGKILVDKGRYADAAKVILEYPEFRKQSPTDAVYLSNMASEAGRMFYWRGAVLQAQQLYRISTRYKVGSEKEMVAEMHLRLLDNDFEGAIAAAASRVERYPNGISYGTYLSLLHMVGRSTEAWQIFDLQLDQPLGVGPWESAMVGLRIARTSQDELYRWISQPKIAHAESPALSWPAFLLILWNTTIVWRPAISLSTFIRLLTSHWA